MEHSKGMYRPIVYFVSKMLTDLPPRIVFSFVGVLIVYFIVGLTPGADKFFIACGIVTLVAIIAAFHGTGVF